MNFEDVSKSALREFITPKNFTSFQLVETHLFESEQQRELEKKMFDIRSAWTSWNKEPYVAVPFTEEVLLGMVKQASSFQRKLLLSLLGFTEEQSNKYLEMWKSE